jgi:putative phage-type endonuclease
MENVIDQRTNEWMNWRALGIGGSDVPSVLGISPYKTAHKLWLEKTGQVQADTTENWAMKRGSLNEPVARAQIELITGKAWPPDLVVDPVKPHFRVSLDGQCGDEIVEIKVPGLEYILKVEAEGVKAIKPDHMAQMQYQLRITAARICHYVLFHPETQKFVSVLVNRDEALIASIEIAVDKFWAHVIAKTEPDSERVDSAFLMYAKEYRELVSTISLLEKKLEKAKTALIAYGDVCAAGLKITSYEVKGTVDYSKINALSSVNLDDFRKPARIQHKITII